MARGDEQRDAEFSAFAATAWPGLARLAWLIVGDDRRAEDAAQSGLAGTWAAWHRIAPDRRTAYARKAVTNAALSDLRSARRHPVEVVAAPPEAAVRGDLADGVVRAQTLRAALQELPPRARAVVVLRWFEDLPEAEVASVLGISIGTVKSTNARGLDRLRESLTTEEADL